MKIEKACGGGFRGVLVVGLISLLALSQGLQAADRTSGAKVRVITAQGLERITGEVIGVRRDAIVIGLEGGETRTIAIEDITSVRVYRHSWALAGALVGALAGGAAGYAISAPQLESEFLGGISIAIYAGIGLAVGGIVGGVSGAAASADPTYDLAKMSPREKDKFVGKLRKMARVREYQ